MEAADATKDRRALTPVVVDPSLVQDYLDSPAGEEAILNVIGRNPGRVKQVVG